MSVFDYFQTRLRKFALCANLISGGWNVWVGEYRLKFELFDLAWRVAVPGDLISAPKIDFGILAFSVIRVCSKRVFAIILPER